jgi:dTDP-4-dehydrorhamnose reductase
MQELASGRPPSSPVLQGHGWWRRPERLLYPPADAGVADPWDAHLPRHAPGPPLLISGANGTLGRAFARICAARNLACHVLTRQEMDIADPASVDAALRHFQPWAIINAGGYVPVPTADHNPERCLRDNAHGPVVLAAACARHAVALLSFSSDRVFDGATTRPYVESDPVAPLSAYGRNQAEAERRVLAIHPAALMVRTSAFFDPWDPHHFVSRALATLAAGQPFSAATDVIVSPTYLPDLAHACLDLLIDRAAGLWHLTSGSALSWAELAQRAAALAGISSHTLTPSPAATSARYSALGSERGQLLPALDDALQRYLHEAKPTRDARQSQRFLL